MQNLITVEGVAHKKVAHKMKKQKNKTKINKRPMGLDIMLDNTDKGSKHIVFFDKQMHQINPKLTSNATRPVTSFISY